MKSLKHLPNIILLLFFSGCNIKNSSPLALSLHMNPNESEIQSAEAQARDKELLQIEPESIGFNLIETHIFKNHCLQCHSEKKNESNAPTSSTGSENQIFNAGGINLESYQSALLDIKSITSAIKKRTMPPASQKKLKLSQAQIDFFQKWVEAGALQYGKQGETPGATPPVPEPPPAPVPPPPSPSPDKKYTFAEIRNLVIEPNCLNCHSEAKGNKGDVNLETYANVFDQKGYIEDDITNGYMPPRRAPQLTIEQKNMILKWIADGAPE